MSSVRPVFEAGDPFVLCAMGTAKHCAAGFMAVADNAAAAVGATRGERMNGALETIEIVRNAVGHDFQRFVILISAYFARLSPSVQRSRWLGSQVRFEDARRLFLFVSFDHGLTLWRNALNAIGFRPVPWRRRRLK